MTKATAIATATAQVPPDGTLTTGDAAAAIGIRHWQLLALLRRKLVAEPRRIANYRVFTPDDLPRLRAAAVRAGYLPPDAAGAAAGQPTSAA